MTTQEDAAPNFPPNMAVNSTLASSASVKITTPFPAARPSAFRTYGPTVSEMKRSPSLSVSGVKDL